jgi:peroxin-19
MDPWSHVRFPSALRQALHWGSLCLEPLHNSDPVLQQTRLNLELNIFQSIYTYLHTITMASEQPKDAEPHQEAPQPTITAASQPTSSNPPPTTTTEPLPASKEAPPEEAPDPDEDDLSDLDDVLDEFATTNISKPAPTSSGPGRPSAESAAAAAAVPRTGGGGAGPGGLFADEDEFAKSLQAGMAELLGEFESNPEMQKQFEDLVKELGEGMSTLPEETGIGLGEVSSTTNTTETPAKEDEESTFIAALAAASSSSSKPETTATASKAAPAAAAAAATEASFQETIRATMERMSASNTAASDAATKSASASSEEDFLAAMLREMEKSGPEGLGAGSDEDFSKMLLGMMEQLTNKEILYEPMKELHDKFPKWMLENRDKCKKEDLERYVEQQRLVGEIVGKFEEKGYSDDKAEYREYIVERMQQVSLST